MLRRFVLALVAIALICSASLALAATLDLKSSEYTTVDAISDAIAAEVDVTQVDLTGVSLTWQQRKQLIAAYPGVDFLWTVQVYGVTVTSEDTDLDLTGVKKPGSYDELCSALSCLPNIQNVYMWNHTVYQNDRAMLSAAFPDVFFGWDIEVNEAHRFRTDITAYSTLSRSPLLQKRHLVNFTYCPNLLALDIGHCYVEDISFLRDCNKLKILIAADAGVRDISALEEQTDLEYLELFMNNITDISVLSKLTNLIDVNLAYNHITDLSPLYDLPKLERLWLMFNNELTQEDFDEFRAHQPDCELVTYSYGSTGNQMTKINGELVQFPGTSWRDHPRYLHIVYIFNEQIYIPWDEPVPADWEPPSQYYSQVYNP